ncbi:MAG: MFS transporter [Gammaproteobacteria bacterium]|nr:MAG: MFS transporter [Gammaproteobacteria bacterium]
MTPSPTAAEALAPAAPDLSARARWTIVGLLATALFINYVDRGAVPTAAHLIQDEIGLSPRQLGLLFSAFFWSYSLLQIPVGWVAERYGAQRVLAAGLAIWACATMLVGLAHSFAALLALRLLLGIGESAGFPSVSKLLALVVPVKDLGTANGIVAFAYLFGPAVGAYCGGLIMVEFGWRAAFWVFGAASLLWLLPWSQVRLPRSAVARSTVGPALRALLRQPSLWGTSLGLFSTNYCFYFMLTSALLAGWVIDRLARAGHANLAYKAVMVAAHAGTVACMLCIALGSQPWAVGAIFLYQVLTGISSPGAFAMSQILAGPTASARWVGIQNCCGNFAGVIAPALTGLLVERSQHFTGAFVVAAAVSVLGLIGWVWMVPKLAPIPWQFERP